TLTVKNVGSGVANLNLVSATLGFSNGGLSASPTVALTTLGPDQTGTYAFSVLGVSAGTTNISTATFAATDANSGLSVPVAAVTSGPVAITVKAKPNLVITALSASPTTISTEQSFQATVTVQNVGGNAATMQFTGESLVFQNGGLIASGTTQATTVTLTGGATRDFTFTVVSGASSGLTTLTSATFIAKDINTNASVQVQGNTATPSTITIQPKPNLVITALSASPTTISTGQSFQATVTVQNVGPTAATIDFTDATLTFLNGGLLASGTSQTTSATLAGGGTTSFTFTVVSAGSSGVTTLTSATFTAKDANTNVTVPVHANSATPQPITIKHRPNLAITAISSSRSVVSTGQSFLATITVQNVGAQAATIQFTDETMVHDGLPAALIDSSLGQSVTLTGGATRDFTFSVQAGTSATAVHITSATFVAYDVNTSAPVQVSANSSSIVTITVQEKPSLQIMALSLSRSVVSTG
ncbi:MAG: hypothetical protein FD127_4124, partial [Acidimicrobiaceae bacterium]